MQLKITHKLQRTIFVPELFLNFYFVHDSFLKVFLCLDFTFRSIFLTYAIGITEDTRFAIYEIL